MAEINELLLTDEEMDKVGFDMGSPFGITDRYTVGRAIAQAQLAKALKGKEVEIEEAVKKERGRIANRLENMDWENCRGAYLVPKPVMKRFIGELRLGKP